MNADSNKRLDMQRRPITVLICFLDSEILNVLYKIEENYMVQHYLIIFKFLPSGLTNMNQNRLLNCKAETVEHLGN